MTSHRAPLLALRGPLAGAVALLLATVGACAPGEGGGPPRVGDPLPDFQAPLLRDAPAGPDAPGATGATGMAGDTVSFADLRGSPLLLNLWATWCPPCRHETPFLQEINERYGERGLRVVGVSVDNRGAAGQARDFLEEAGAGYLQLHDPTMGIMDLFSVPGLPATFLVDGDGMIRWTRLGPVTEDDPGFAAALDSLVAGAS